MIRTFAQQLTVICLLCQFGFSAPVSAGDAPVNWQSVDADESGDSVSPSPNSQLVHYRLEKVVIRGNRKTMRSVILRYLEIKPGDVFAAEDTSLEEARYRMLASGLFRTVNFELKKGSARGYVVLEIRVLERNTIVVNDLSVGITQILPNEDQIVPFGSVGLLERSFLGTGIELGGTLAASADQSAYRIYWRDNHFLNSRFGIHLEGLFAEAEEYFGNHFLPGPGENALSSKYEIIEYRRAGIRLGTGYNLLSDYFFWCDFRFENILRDEPRVIDSDDIPSNDDGPAEPVPYMEPDDSVLTSILLGVTVDTTNHPVLPSDGSKTQFSVELSHPLLGSDYDFVKFQLSHRILFPIGKEGQSIGLEGVGGLISGSAPFFDQFFVGDYSAFVPDRKLGLNFTNLHPGILDTAIKDMWYEDLVLSLSTEWSRPIYRGSGNLYGINVFVRMGVFVLASSQDLYTNHLPIDMTGDFGIRIDTSVGVFSFSFASVLQLIPPIRKETTE